MNVTTAILYEDYKLATGKKYSYDKWLAILTDIILLIAAELIKGDIWVLPRQMGFISIVKERSSNKVKGAFANKEKLNPKAYKLMQLKFNFNTFGYLFKTRWDRRLAYTKMANRMYYKFKWGGIIKTMIHNHIVETHSNREELPFDTPLKRV